MNESMTTQVVFNWFVQFFMLVIVYVMMSKGKRVQVNEPEPLFTKS